MLTQKERSFDRAMSKIYDKETVKGQTRSRPETYLVTLFTASAVALQKYEVGAANYDEALRLAKGDAKKLGNIASIRVQYLPEGRTEPVEIPPVPVQVSLQDVGINVPFRLPNSGPYNNNHLVKVDIVGLLRDQSTTLKDLNRKGFSHVLNLSTGELWSSNRQIMVTLINAKTEIMGDKMKTQ